MPQPRKRLFVVGIKAGGNISWPPSVDRKPTLRQAIGDLPEVEGGQRQEEITYIGPPRTKFARRMRRDLDGDDQEIIRDHITRHVREDDAEIYAEMKPGQTYKDVPEKLRRYRSDIFNDKYNRLIWNGLSRTITAHIAKDGYWYIHPSQDRTLSVREAARIQTFPDDFRFAGTPSNRYRQIGNAVPPMLAEAVGHSLVKSMRVTEVRESSVHMTHQASGTNSLNGLPTMADRILGDFDMIHGLFFSRKCASTGPRADQVAGIYPRLLELSDSPETC